MIKRISLPKLATITATITASSLAILKLVIWIISWSMSLISSALDSLMDVFISIFNTFALHLSEKKPNENFNYGLWKIEALAALLEWSIITLIWIYIIYQSIQKALTNEPIQYIEASLLVITISFILTLILVSFLSYVAKKTNNLVVKSDNLHYKTDLLTNWAILLSLIIIYFTNLYWIDAILWIIIWLYIIKESSELAKDWLLILLDISISKEKIQKIENILDNFKKENLIKWYHWLRTRNMGNAYQIELHLHFEPNITIEKAHEIWDKIANQIKNIENDKKWIIIPHFDPTNKKLSC